MNKCPNCDLLKENHLFVCFECWRKQMVVGICYKDDKRN